MRTLARLAPRRPWSPYFDAGHRQNETHRPYLVMQLVEGKHARPSS